MADPQARLMEDAGRQANATATELKIAVVVTTGFALLPAVLLGLSTKRTVVLPLRQAAHLVEAVAVFRLASAASATPQR